jgi:hypothetical protein
MKCSQNTPGFTKTKFFKKNIFWNFLHV